MKTYCPSYYGKFRCLAGDCPDSCCKSWEIVIDEKTSEKYNALTSLFGEKLRSKIIIDDDGDKCFSLVEGRCPFLNKDGLCDVHITLGEEYTSEICRVHPRFVEEYESFTEISLSLSCPETVRLMFDAENRPVYPVPVYNGDDEVLSLLIESRAEILSCGKNFSDTVNCFLETAARDEADINFYYVDNVKLPDTTEVKNYLELLSQKCEILTVNWRNILNKALEYKLDKDTFVEFMSSSEERLIRIFDYFVYRYYLKSVNDLDVYLRALFIVLSVFAISAAALANSMPIEEAARLYSKEIEHSTENIDIILDNIGEY